MWRTWRSGGLADRGVVVVVVMMENKIGLQQAPNKAKRQESNQLTMIPRNKLVNTKASPFAQVPIASCVTLTDGTFIMTTQHKHGSCLLCNPTPPPHKEKAEDIEYSSTALVGSPDRRYALQVHVM